MTKYDKYFTELVPNEQPPAGDNEQYNTVSVGPEDLQAVESRINKAIEDSINRLEQRLKVSNDTNNSNNDDLAHGAENSAEKE